MDALEKLRIEMTEKLLSANTTGIALDSLAPLVRLLTEDWEVEKLVSIEHVPSDEPRVRYMIKTPVRALTEAEQWLQNYCKTFISLDNPRPDWTDLKEGHAHSGLSGVSEWKQGGYLQSPPPGVTFAEMLKQGVWWQKYPNFFVRLVDTSPGHRARILSALKGSAAGYHAAASERFAGAPDGIYEEFVALDPWKWLRSQELLKALRKLVKKDRREGLI